MINLGKIVRRCLTLSFGLFLSLVCLSGCNSTSKDPIERIYFPNKTLEVIVGHIVKMDPIVEPSNAYTGDLKWCVDELDEYTASVDENGEVTGNHVGQVGVHIYDPNNENIEASYRLYVTEQPKPGNLKVSIDDVFNEIAVSSKVRLMMKLTGSNIAYDARERISVTTNDSDIVDIVLENYVYYLYGKKPGKASIHVEDNYDKNSFVDFEITVKQPYLRAIALPNEYIYLVSTNETYKSFDLKPEIHTLGDLDISLSYSSSDSDIVSVDNNGHLIAKKEGRATINVSCGEESTTCDVIVSEDNSVLPAEGAIRLGEEQEEFFEITGLLEKYANDNFIGGIPILTYDDGFSSSNKLNLNTCNQRQWERFFGVGGSVYQTPKEDYWEVEPAMSNYNFLNGIRYGIDRVHLSETVENKLPKYDLFSNAVIDEDERNIKIDTSYRDSIYHQNACKDLIEGTDGYGYSFEKSKQYFIDASNELIESGVYKAGDTIEIEISWPNNLDTKIIYKYVKEDLEKAFNVNDNPLKLKVVNSFPDVWSNVYYEKSMRGQYDISFGMVSGSNLYWQYFNPIAMAVTNSDRNPWCLNFGQDTNDITGGLVYKNKLYSIEALVNAVNVGALVNKGMYQDPVVVNDLNKTTLSFNDNDQMILDTYFLTKYAEKIFYSLEKVSLYSFNGNVNYKSGYFQLDALEINKIGEVDNDGWQRYQIVFDRNELSPINNEINEMAFNREGVSFDFYFNRTYFSEQTTYPSYYCFITLNKLINNFYDLFK